MFDELTTKLTLYLQDFFKTDYAFTLKRKENNSVNTIYEFTFNRKDYIIKILTRTLTSESEFFRLEKEATLIEHFTAFGMRKGIAEDEQLEVPVPEVIAIESDVERIGFKFIILSKVKGVTLEEIWCLLDEQTKINIIKELGRIIKGIHSLSYEMFGEIEDYYYSRKFYSFVGLLKANLRKNMTKLCKSKLLPMELITKAEKYVEDHLEQVTFIDTPKLVHNDLNFTNILVTQNINNPKIIAILDFEWSYAGDPIFDLLMCEEDWMKEGYIQEAFYSIYNKNQDNMFGDYQIKKKIFRILSALDTITFGWVYFHQTEENIHSVKKKLEELVL